MCRPLLEDRARPLRRRNDRLKTRIVPCWGLYQQSLIRPSVVARCRPTLYQYGGSGCRETSEGAVEGIMNQKKIKLAPKQYNTSDCVM
jgi:hypothetical protein